MAIESSVTAPLFFKICILYALSILSECAPSACLVFAEAESSWIHGTGETMWRLRTKPGFPARVVSLSSPSLTL